MFRYAVVTISDRAAAGNYEDRSGPLITSILARRTDWQLADSAIVNDDISAISNLLIDLSNKQIDLILTTGGTGFAPRDVTPEATDLVIEREAPGISETLRVESMKVTRHAMLSRGKAGIRNKTLIINLPGNPKAVKESLDILLPVLPHALSLISGASDESSHRTV